jgi:hypothetical protein
MRIHLVIRSVLLAGCREEAPVVNMQKTQDLLCQGHTPFKRCPGLLGAARGAGHRRTAAGCAEPKWLVVADNNVGLDVRQLQHRNVHCKNVARLLLELGNLLHTAD